MDSGSNNCLKLISVGARHRDHHQILQIDNCIQRVLLIKIWRHIIFLKRLVYPELRRLLNIHGIVKTVGNPLGHPRGDPEVGRHRQVAKPLQIGKRGNDLRQDYFLLIDALICWEEAFVYILQFFDFELFLDLFWVQSIGPATSWTLELRF